MDRKLLLIVPLAAFHLAFGVVGLAVAFSEENPSFIEFAASAVYLAVGVGLLLGRKHAWYTAIALNTAIALLLGLNGLPALSLLPIAAVIILLLTASKYYGVSISFKQTPSPSPGELLPPGQAKPLSMTVNGKRFVRRVNRVTRS